MNQLKSLWVLNLLSLWMGYIICEATLSSSILKELLNAQPNEPVDFLIQLAPSDQGKFNPSKGSMIKFIELLKSHADVSQSRLLNTVKKLQEEGKVEYLQSYYISNTLAVRALPEVVKELAKFPEIKEISGNKRFKAKIGGIIDSKVTSSTAKDISWSGDEILWSIKFINATNLNRNVMERAGRLIYGNADTGVDYKHPVLINNYMGLKNGGSDEMDHNYAWWDANKRANSTRPNPICGINSKVPCDDNDHGTHTMSTVIGSKGLGVSPTTKWMACKNMDQNFGSPESYLGCLQFFLAPTDLNGENPRPELRPHVVGNSYGCPPNEGCSRTTFDIAFKAMKDAGIFLSVSAGNDGSQGCSSIISPPAIDPSSFNVAASNYQSLDRASFSSMGPVPERSVAIDVTAPGVNITGAVRGGGFATLQGTSMAAPHVSGAALLIMAACPQLERKVQLVEQLLRNTATPNYATQSCGGDTGNVVPNNEYGFGVINVAKAIEKCSQG